MTARAISTEFSLPNRRRKNQRSPVRWIISLALPYWVLVLTMMIGAFGNAALAAVIPVVIGMAFNAIQQTPPNTGFLPVAAFWIVVSQIIRGGLQFVRNFSAELLGQRLERDIREELYVSLLGKSMAFHSLQPVGDTMARATNDVREINYMFSPGLNLVVGSAIFLIVPLIVAPRYYPTLIIVPAVYIVLYFLSLWQYLRELDPITEEVRTSFGEMNAHLAEAIDGIETVKGMAQEGSEALRFGKNARRFRDAFVRQGDVEARFLPLLLLGVAEAVALAQAMLLYQRGLLNLGDVVGYFGLILLFGFPTFISLFAYSQVSLGIASARRILELINRENHLDQNEQGYNRPMTGEIEFRHVTFAYPDGETVLEDISVQSQTRPDSGPGRPDGNG